MGERARLLERGLIVPLERRRECGEWRESATTLRLDEVGRRVAATRIASGPVDTSDPRYWSPRMADLDETRGSW